MMKKTKTPLFIGTYTNNSPSEGIYFCDFNTDTGIIEEPILGATLTNPSYLTFDVKHKVLFAVSETSDFCGHNGGSVSSFALQEDMSLKLISSQPTYGKDPCHLCLSADAKRLFVANYSEGSLSVFPVAKTGEIMPLIQSIKHQGSGPNAQRQEQAHVHFVTIVSGGVCLVDLGMDEILWYSMIGEKLKEEPYARVSLPPGSGPRHLVFHPAYPIIYVLQELSNQVIAVQLDAKGSPLTINQILTTLPEDFQGESTCAAIRINKEGTLLFASNRGHDSVAVWQIEQGGRIKPAKLYQSGGQTPRDICLSPDEKWLLCANQSGEVTVLQVNQETGELSKPISAVDFGTPVNLLFI